MRREEAIVTGALLLALISCGAPAPGGDGHREEGDHAEAVATGPKGGRLLVSGDFTLELAIFERGVPPEFRAWAREDGRPVAPRDVKLAVTLERLGGRIESIAFAPEEGFLRGDAVVAEPHSFEVSVEAVHDGQTHRWRYESFEGRTRIAPEVAASLGIESALAGPVRLEETVEVYGRIRPDPERVRELRARFDGVIRSVDVGVGRVVERGERLLTIESDESLRAYSIAAPIGGIVTQRDANPGEQTSGRLLLTITDPSTVWADLAVFPDDRGRVQTGNPVAIVPAAGGDPVVGAISNVDVIANPDQSLSARAVLPNASGRLAPGTFVSGRITVGEHEVALAVRREALQTYRDFRVVYAQVGDEYEVRMLDLGREAGDWVEVLGGIEPGTRYVTTHSYVIKADIEKSGAAHDH